MLVGEPGVGKTTLCEQLAAYARQRSAQVVVGHCYGAESPVSYRPFAEAIGNIVASLDPSTLRTIVGNSAFAVARLLPEVAELFDLPTDDPGDLSGQENHYRLLRGVTAFLHRMADTTPMLFVLEDLHDADHATLDLLVHLSRNLTDSRLCIVGTYRDTEVSRAHPLSTTLAELRRGTAFFERIPIHGLEPEEISARLAQCGITDADGELARKVHSQTEGNALFVNELVSYLVRQVPGSAPSLPVQVPEGLRDVLGQHLSRLSHATNDLLRIAAVIGREFRLDVLSAVSQMPDDELVACLEEACAAALVVEQGMLLSTVGYTFRHALIRQVLYEELALPDGFGGTTESPAAVLEQVHRGRLEDHASELAEHFAYSATVPELAKAVSYRRSCRACLRLPRCSASPGVRYRNPRIAGGSGFGQALRPVAWPRRSSRICWRRSASGRGSRAGCIRTRNRVGRPAPYVPRVQSGARRTSVAWRHFSRNVAELAPVGRTRG
jgi:hypothetical protein